MWTSAFNFILALLIFAFNLLVLVAISSDHRLHTTTHLLSTNLWLCNCISAIVTVFFSLSPSSASLDDIVLPCTSGNLGGLEKQYEVTEYTKPSKARFGGMEMFSAHSSAVLLNSTVSLLTLLTIGVVHALSRHNYHLSRSQSSRLLASTWLLVVFLLLADFFLIRITRSFLLAVPFHLALLSVFLVLNLIVHPINLVLLSRCRNNGTNEPERAKLLEESATASLWLLLNSLSFVIIAMMVVWETKGGKESMESIMGIEMAAYSVHCVANPLIAVIRDRNLENSLGRILMTSKRQTTDEDLVIALMRDPPPPYST